METKSYFSSSVPAALELARKELGPDALLVSSRPSPPQSARLGRLEVTFRWDPAARPPILSAAVPPASSTNDLEDIRHQLAALRTAVARKTGDPATDEYSDETLRLRDAGLDLTTARQIAAAAAGAGDFDSAVLTALSRQIRVQSFEELKPGENRTLAFIGPPGRGKTTSLVKIAVRHGIARRVPVRIYSAGAHAIGAADQMTRYAAILGVPFQTFESFESLGLALAGESWRGLVLIDTPGISPAETEELRFLARFFSAHSEVEKHLVLRADAGTADNTSVVSRFSALEPGRLLFTGLDEASGSGSVIGTLIRTGIPATFAATGQRIPEDIGELDAGRLIGSFWPTGARTCQVMAA